MRSCCCALPSMYGPEVCRGCLAGNSGVGQWSHAAELTPTTTSTVTTVECPTVASVPAAPCQSCVFYELRKAGRGRKRVPTCHVIGDRPEETVRVVGRGECKTYRPITAKEGE